MTNGSADGREERFPAMLREVLAEAIVESGRQSDAGRPQEFIWGGWLRSQLGNRIPETTARPPS